MRTLVSFFALGAVLWLSKVQWEKGRGAERPTLQVQVSVGANAAVVAHAIERAALCEHAISLGAAYTDAIARKELLSAIPPEFDGEPTRARIERALALGVHRAAPVVCERLAFQARQSLPLEVHPPSADMLDRYLGEHAARYRVPARVDGIQITISVERHGAHATEVANQRLARARNLDDSGRALELADPSLLPGKLEAMTADELDHRFGPGFGSAVFALDSHTWSAPLPSRFGLHLVRLDTRRPEHLPPLDVIGERLRKDFLIDARALAERRAVQSVRARYRIELREVPP